MANGTSGTKGGGGTATAKPVNNLPTAGELSPVNDRLDWIDKNTTGKKSMQYDTLQALNSFTGHSSGSIRDAQKVNNNDEYGKKGQLIEDYIKNAPQWDNSHDLHRGMGAPKDFLAKIKQAEGTNTPIDINNSGTASWSLKYNVSENFANGYGDNTPVIFRTKTMKNATPIMHISKFTSEKEVLSSKDNRFKIKKISHKNIDGQKGYLIDVEPI